jgi:hypothetical protein
MGESKNIELEISPNFKYSFRRYFYHFMCTPKIPPNQQCSKAFFISSVDNYKKYYEGVKTKLEQKEQKDTIMTTDEMKQLQQLRHNMMSCCLREEFAIPGRREMCCDVIVNDQHKGDDEVLELAGEMHPNQLKHYYELWRCNPEEPKPVVTCQSLELQFNSLVSKNN